MARFIGKVFGKAKTEASRLGSEKSGLETVAASWNGAIKVQMWVNADGDDCYRVVMIPWEGAGEYRVIEEGIFK